MMPSKGHRRTGNPRGNPNWRKKKEEAQAAQPPTSAPVDEDTDMNTPVDEQVDELDQDAIQITVEDAPEEPEPEPLTWQERAKLYARDALEKVGFTGGKSGDAESNGGGSASRAGGGGGRLGKRQQEFADTVTPMFVGALILGMKWVYSKRGREYVILAPSDEQAHKMIAPLIRIWARRAKAGGISPDTLDMLACLGACFAYGRSVQNRLPHVQAMYAQQEPQAYEPNTYEQREYNAYENAGIGRAEYVQPGYDADAYEAGYSGRDYRRGDASGAAAGDQADGGRDGVRGSVNLDNLTEHERAHYSALLRLRERDFASRARRSGNVRITGIPLRGGHQRMGRRAG